MNKIKGTRGACQNRPGKPHLHTRPIGPQLRELFINQQRHRLVYKQFSQITFNPNFKGMIGLTCHLHHQVHDRTYQVPFGGHAHQDEVISHSNFLPFRPLLRGRVDGPPTGLTWSAGASETDMPLS